MTELKTGFFGTERLADLRSIKNIPLQLNLNLYLLQSYLLCNVS